MPVPPPPAPPAPPARKRRGCLRRLTGSALLCLGLLGLAVIGAGWWLGQVGLPEPLKQRLVAELRHAGWTVQFTRLRWGPRQGVVVENLELERTNAANGPRLFVDAAQCRLSPAALRKFQLRVEAVHVAGAQLVWPVDETNRPLTRLIVRNMSGAVRFKSPNLWELDGLRALLAGVRIQLSGAVTNASLLRDWKMPRRAKRAAGPAAPLWWRRLVRAADQFQFQGVPELTGQFRANAANFDDCEAHVRVSVPSVVCPFGAGRNLRLEARLAPSPNPEAETRVNVSLSAEQARTPWGGARSFLLEATLEPTLTRLLPTNSTLRLEVHDAQTPWVKAAKAVITHQFLPSPTNEANLKTIVTVEATQLHANQADAAAAMLVANFWHPATNWMPATVSGDLHLEKLRTPWGGAQQADWAIHGALPGPEHFHLFRTNLVWLDRLANLEVDASAVLRQVTAQQLQSERLSLTNRWQGRQWDLSVAGQFTKGNLNAQLALDARRREVRFHADSTLDPFQFAPVLGTNLQRWLARASWQSPPDLRLEGRCQLPDWTNRAPDWGARVLPTLELAGQARLGPCAFDQAQFQAIDLPFALTNQVLTLPGAVVSRPEGRLEGSLTADLPHQEIHAQVRSGLDPTAFKPWLAGQPEEHAFDLLQFTTPPLIAGELRGRLDDPTLWSAQGRFEATNFTFRGEYVGRCQTGINFTNQIIELLEPSLERPGERGAAPLLSIDLPKGLLFLINAQGNLDPYALTRAIGRKTGEAIAPYRYESPPHIVANGIIDLKKHSYDDHLHLDIAGGPFQWEVFHLQALQGSVDFESETVTLTNVLGKLHGGEVRGGAHFDFSVPGRGTDFSFHTQAGELDFHSLMRDIDPQAKTNKLEGTLSGVLLVHSANTLDPQSWQGEGNLRLLNGVIWDIPLFGLFSPVLNAFVPGLGNSRAREGRASFLITNSVVSSKDLEIHATAMRMRFQGTVDFSPRVEGRMEAELLRDVPGIGFFVSKVFWPVTKLFEYKLTGPLKDPQKEPLYLLPKIILLPFHPLRTLKDLLAPLPGAPEPIAPEPGP